MSDDDLVLVRRDDLRMAIAAAEEYDVRLPQEQGGGEFARLLDAVNGEASTDERDRANTAYDALREIETIMRTAGSDSSMLDGIAAVVSNGPLDTAPGGPREDECHRLMGERDRYRDALERVAGICEDAASDGCDCDGYYKCSVCPGRIAMRADDAVEVARAALNGERWDTP